MVTDGDVTIKNKVKDFLRGATPPRIKRRSRDSFFLANIAIVALVALTAISYRPSGAASHANRPDEDARVVIEREPASGAPFRYPIISAVKVVLESGAEIYLEERTAAMLGVVKFAKTDAGNAI